MITTVEIKNIATFNESGIIISGLKKVNFFYGVNGSGKTTISNFIYDPQNEKFKDCRIKWLSDIELKKLIYNKAFRDRNFGKGPIPGVFTLGQASKEETEAIEKKKIELDELKQKGVDKKNTLQKQIDLKTQQEEDFREDIWASIYKKHEDNFKEAFKGVLQKKTFLNRLIDEFENNDTETLEIAELKRKAKTIFGKTPSKLDEILSIDFSVITNIEKDQIWAKKIIGKKDIDIANLIQRLNINDWVNEGRAYLTEDDICPFCQQKTITNEFREKLENYFDETFIAETNKVKSLCDDYERHTENLLNSLQVIEANEKINTNTKLNIDQFASLVKTLTSQFVANKEILNRKRKEPSRNVSLTQTKEQLVEIQSLIIRANQEIKNHNNLVDNYSSERQKLINEIWKYICIENELKLSKYIKDQKGLQKGIDNLNTAVESLRNEWKALDRDVKSLTKNMTSIQPSVDEINTTLKSFGFTNFEIVPSKVGLNHYQIQRENGELAESTLSEGEISFITFLYFLQLAKGSTEESDILEDRVLIIDDPVSSLDSNVLFVVSSLIRGIASAIKQGVGIIKQLILLTHNVYFHKEASFINGRIQECSETNYWILRKIDCISYLQNFEKENPIQNSYELLWKELKDKERNSGITIQNTMRRIIENYFKILGKFTDETLINQFKNPQEKEICRSLICWVNEGSHTIPDDLFVEIQDSTIDSYFKVFRQIFQETGHIEHYNMMMN